ncbi:MAG: hypothetical protein A2Y24_01145 [Clostridiales bacterium GWE2_32_10]|nr:MAG: hypothetical protein A2Y24_01145 [Clostridiales bacterium GWE2_32_10]HBY21219.1 dTDP-4-dehydrorhamnose 3,5-epimerase [Clostridiales bacterium]
MSNINLTEVYIKGLYIIETKQVRLNESDFFVEIYNKKLFNQYEINNELESNIEITTKKGCMRGLYFYRNISVFKLVRVIKGEVYFVAIDLRRESATFGKYYGITLSEHNRKQFYIPDKFAYGFLALDDVNTITINSNVYDINEEKLGIAWNDRDLKIEWPLDKAGNIIVSRQDQRWAVFKEILKIL